MYPCAGRNIYFSYEMTSVIPLTRRMGFASDAESRQQRKLAQSIVLTVFRVGDGSTRLTRFQSSLGTE